jgi:hypothetical protein
MRLTKPRLLAVPIIMLSFAVTACGSNTVTVQEVPGDPVALTVPGTGEAFAPTPTATPSATPTTTPEAGTAQATPTATAPASNGGATQTTPQDTTGGGAQAPAGADSATNDQPPPGGSDAQQYEDFCAANPGAC